MKELTIGSLFAGIGGLELGLERAIPGARTIWQVEQDPYARRVLAKHWPQANRSVTDVRQAGAHNLERPGILAGGFPCQDISTAGKQAGIDGERSGLWFEFARIIGELRPRFVVLENVSAIRSRGLGTVLGPGLATLGYDALWDCIPAAAVGAPHRRDRWFCIGWPNDGYPHSHSQSAITKHDEASRLQAMDNPGIIGWNRRTGLEGTALSGSAGWWETESSVGRGPDGLSAGLDGPGIAPWERGIPRTVQGKIPDRVSRLRCLGNAVVPQVAEVIGRVICELERTR